MVSLLVSDVVDQKGIIEAYKAEYKTMKRLTGLWIDPFEVKLVGPATLSRRQL